MNRDDFGKFLWTIRESVHPGGSELGAGLMLFSLASSIRAATIIEIGRCQGYSALALAGALKLLDDPKWRDPEGFQNRPEVDYGKLYNQPVKRRLYSVDPNPQQVAVDRLQSAGLLDYVELIDKTSIEALKDPRLPGEADFVFIDGDHSEHGCMTDVNHYVPRLRPGGLFVLHDYFGWYDQDCKNRSPIKAVCDNIERERFTQHVLIDTGGPSMVVYRKPDPRLGV